MQSRRTNIAGIVVTFLGLLQAVGFVLTVGGVPHAQALIRAGQGIGIAALPTPFRDSNGYENFASRRAYMFTLRDGTVRELSDQDIGSIMPGPHRRIVPYFNALAMLPRLPHDLTTSVLQHLFCKSDFAEGKGIAQPGNTIADVEIQVSVKTQGREGFVERPHIVCE